MPLASGLGTGIQGRACRVGTMQDRDQSTLTPPGVTTEAPCGRLGPPLQLGCTRVLGAWEPGLMEGGSACG